MAISKSLTVDQGSTDEFIFTLSVLTDPSLPYNASTNPYIPLNLTDYDVDMQVRATFDSTAPILTFSSTGVNPAIVITPLTGEIALTVKDTVTTAVVFKGESVSYYYDMEIVDVGGRRKRVVQGSFDINREVTR